ncbi:hypothetical protein FM996_10510 [Methylosinus sporium]|uniref:Phosphodiesterase n=1 Tax=Methylosinus sporium TaxID=428 RepID=A0A549SWJ9_METSR|nr:MULTISPECIES: hypothetical protein [Methylosinus]MBU3888376.1 hypothetical protein [Methylosinus sp. KRF6]TRL33957.1 hypothetical protein FM996_10510 [Methylosinus sporium]
MQILSHRGWWRSPEEKNSAVAMQRAFAAGFGVETDVRDCDGALVISHDMPRTRQGIPFFTFDDFLALYTRIGAPSTLALNIKSDGLVEPLREALAAHGVTRYFVFDMSIPDTRSYLSHGLTVFTRWSEYEPGSRLDEAASGFWLDAFEDAFVEPRAILSGVDGGKKVAIVSPELHHKPHLDAWRIWRHTFETMSPAARELIFLCTDLPGDANVFFNAVALPSSGAYQAR